MRSFKSRAMPPLRHLATLGALALHAGLVTRAIGAEELPQVHIPVFAPDSFWYQKIPVNAPIHPKSADFVREFLAQKEQYYKTVSINTTKYASPVYVVGTDVPTQKVHFWDCQKKGRADPGLASQWSSVPIPDFAAPADGTDSEMTIYQPATDTLWEFWVARRTEGRWDACWGGRLDNVSRSPGIWPRAYGTTATGLPFIGGQLTVAELRKGEVNHVMGLSLVRTERADVFSWPANRSDGLNPQNEPNRIPEGLRVRLDPAVDVDALQMHPVGKAIARAAQTYGFVVWDKAGALTLRAENPKAFTARGAENPYNQIFGRTPAYAILNGFPWERLQFLPMHYGRP